MNESSRTRLHIRIGTAATYDDTKYSELTSLLCTILQAKCVHLNYTTPFKTIIADVGDGRIEMSIPDATMTAARLQLVDFSEPLFVSSNSYVIDSAEPVFCIQPLLTFDVYVYILTTLTTIFLFSLPHLCEHVLGSEAGIRRWKLNTFRSIITLVLSVEFFKFMLLAFYSAQMKDTLTEVCKPSERYSSHELQAMINDDEGLAEVQVSWSNESYLNLALGFQNRSETVRAVGKTIKIDNKKALPEIFDCSEVRDRMERGKPRLIFIDNTAKIIENLRDQIQRCCVDVYKIDDLPVEFLGFAINKRANITEQVSRAVRTLRAFGFVHRFETRNENFAIPKCEKEKQQEFVNEASTLDELKFAFFVLLPGCGAAFGCFTVERLLNHRCSARKSWNSPVVEGNPEETREAEEMSTAL